MPIQLPQPIKTTRFWYIVLAVLVIPYAYLCAKNPWFADYHVYLSPWVDYIRSHGGWRSLADLYSNYPAPYLYFLTIISYLPCAPLIPIRLFSILFSIIGGWYLGKIVYLKYREEWVKVAAMTLSLIIPTVMINGAYWAQCDSIYTALVIISLYYLIQRRMIWSMIWLGVAFSFKLQTVFIFPVYIIFILRGELRWWQPLVALGGWIAMWIPAIAVGCPIARIWQIYLWQISAGDAFVKDFTNIWNLFPDAVPYNMWATLVILSVIFAFTLFLYYRTRKCRLSNEFVVNAATVIVAFVLLILPKMHERYLYLGDILIVAYIFYFPKMWLPAVVLPSISLLSYFYFFCYCTSDYYVGLYVPEPIIIAASIIYVLAVASMIIYLVKVQIPKLKPKCQSV